MVCSKLHHIQPERKKKWGITKGKEGRRREKERRKRENEGLTGEVEGKGRKAGKRRFDEIRRGA